MNLVQQLQEGGTGAYAALGFGALALPVALFALVAMLNKSRTAFTLGILTSLLGLAGAASGMFGTVFSRHRVREAIASAASEIDAERLTLAGWSEASNAALFGFFAALIPLVLGGISALAGARAGADTRGRSTLAVILMTLTALAASGAWAFAHQAPPKGRFDFAVDDDNAWQLAAALENTDGDKNTACLRLEHALDEYWKPTDKTEWPRVMRSEIPASLAERWKVAAKNCMQLRIESGVTPALLESPLLHDADQREQVLARSGSPAIRAVIHRSGDVLRNCVESGEPHGGGVMTVDFTIDVDGSVSNARSVDQSAAGACVVKVFTTMKFAVRPEPTHVSYPLLFDVVRDE